MQAGSTGVAGATRYLASRYFVAELPDNPLAMSLFYVMVYSLGAFRGKRPSLRGS